MQLVEILQKREYIQGATPSLASGIVFTVAFSLFLSITSFSCILYHQWWFLGSWCTGLIIEILGYSGRIWYTINDNSSGAYIMQSLCLTISPIFLMAGIYNILAQLILIYGNNFSILKPKKYAAIFVTCDVISLFVQGAGGGLSGASSDPDTGRYIEIAGLAFQAFTMTIFQYFWYTFLWKVYKSKKLFDEDEFNPRYLNLRKNNKFMKPFILAVSISVILIYTRSIYRAIEMGKGYTSYLTTNEIYFDILDGLMVALSGLLMSIVSPGLVYGKNSHLYFRKDGYDHDIHDIKDYDSLKQRLEL
ncbi:hypothetical protein C6P40_002823 [Pichia californica]|uniref:Sphingoid long-chain base transporter RSB1 n=1 Tax=Pichia californica TaxID=460514 RepID=A0A9P6WQP7_9ASCO|nr:hypothetical protein C6P42_004491 [[Candida] californica]KAG0690448.1 hypothetical protein C6P40_002823 [[Candida] californica]